MIALTAASHLNRLIKFLRCDCDSVGGEAAHNHANGTAVLK